MTELMAIFIYIIAGFNLMLMVYLQNNIYKFSNLYCGIEHSLQIGIRSISVSSRISQRRWVNRWVDVVGVSQRSWVCWVSWSNYWSTVARNESRVWCSNCQSQKGGEGKDLKINKRFEMHKGLDNRSNIYINLTNLNMLMRCVYLTSLIK